MGHRALIAYERPDSLYNLHYSHWGALNLRLKYDLSERTPFAGERESEWSQHYYTELLRSECESEVSDPPSVENRPKTRVDPEPIAVRVTMDDIVSSHLDFLHHEALYVVSRAFEVTAYRTLWFGLQFDCGSVEAAETVGNGALCTVRWYEGEPVNDGFLRGQFRALKDIVGERIDDGDFSTAEATEYMVEKLRAWHGDELEWVIRPLTGV